MCKNKVGTAEMLYPDILLEIYISKNNNCNGKDNDENNNNNFVKNLSSTNSFNYAMLDNTK